MSQVDIEFQVLIEASQEQTFQRSNTASMPPPRLTNDLPRVDVGFLVLSSLISQVTDIYDLGYDTVPPPQGLKFPQVSSSTLANFIPQKNMIALISDLAPLWLRHVFPDIFEGKPVSHLVMLLSQ